MSIIDFMIKHPIIAMFMFGDLCVLINNVVQYVTNTGIKRRKFLKERIKDVIDTGVESIEEQLDKNNKVEIGFHSNK